VIRRRRTYYERNIEPILLQKCAGNTSGCHSINEGDPFAFAAGNLDVTSFENIQKRRDVLTPFGMYPQALLLIKSVGAKQLRIQYGKDMAGNPAFPFLDVQHSGGNILDVGSDAYFTLQNWLDNGATENGSSRIAGAQARRLLDVRAARVPPPQSAAMANPSFAEFRSSALILNERAAAPVVVTARRDRTSTSPAARTIGRPRSTSRRHTRS
jgi:hypothetical protein